MAEHGRLTTIDELPDDLGARLRAYRHADGVYGPNDARPDQGAVTARWGAVRSTLMRLREQAARGGSVKAAATLQQIALGTHPRLAELPENDRAAAQRVAAEFVSVLPAGLLPTEGTLPPATLPSPRVGRHRAPVAGAHRAPEPLSAEPATVELHNLTDPDRTTDLGKTAVLATVGGALDSDATQVITYPTPGPAGATTVLYLGEAPTAVIPRVDDTAVLHLHLPL